MSILGFLACFVLPLNADVDDADFEILQQCGLPTDGSNALL